MLHYMGEPLRKTFLFALLLLALAGLAWGQRGAGTPGALNYFEGQAYLGQGSLDTSAVGSVRLEPGQQLVTENGKAEILLTPGAFLRLGDNSSVRMISARLTDTILELERGRAMVEVAQLYSQNNLEIRMGNATARITKNGLYDFDAGRGQVRVFDGKVVLIDGDRHIDINGGHLADLNSFRTDRFDKDAYQDDLYQWSSLRSAYVAEANIGVAQTYVPGGNYYNPGSSWNGSGWYWDPWSSGYTFVPADNMFYSPFGWGYYSPTYVNRAPIVVYPRYRRFDPSYRNGYNSGYSGGYYASPRARQPVTNGQPMQQIPTQPGARSSAPPASGFHPSPRIPVQTQPQPQQIQPQPQQPSRERVHPTRPEVRHVDPSPVIRPMPITPPMGATRPAPAQPRPEVRHEGQARPEGQPDRKPAERPKHNQ